MRNLITYEILASRLLKERSMGTNGLRGEGKGLPNPYLVEEQLIHEKRKLKRVREEWEIRGK